MICAASGGAFLQVHPVVGVVDPGKMHEADPNELPTNRLSEAGYNQAETRFGVCDPNGIKPRVVDPPARFRADDQMRNESRASPATPPLC
jgi:hypothetical protein